MEETMGQGMNKVILLGNLGDKPELRFSASGTAVLKMRVATSESRPDGEGHWKPHTEWHRATIFGKRAEALHKHLRKGSAVLLEGRLHTSSYEKEGTKRYSTEIVVDDLCFASSGTSPRSAPGEEPGARFAPAGAKPGMAPGLVSTARPLGAERDELDFGKPPSWAGAAAAVG
jgi:single-strand DNA-binding protein